MHGPFRRAQFLRSAPSLTPAVARDIGALVNQGGVTGHVSLRFTRLVGAVPPQYVHQLTAPRSNRRPALAH
jgi:hypothetical protein